MITDEAIVRWLGDYLRGDEPRAVGRRDFLDEQAERMVKLVRLAESELALARARRTAYRRLGVA